MTSATPAAATDQDGLVKKADWVEPAVSRFDVGDAEASDGPGPDGGLAS